MKDYAGIPFASMDVIPRFERIAFTGPSRGVDEFEDYIRSIVVQLKADEFISGAANGVDLFVALHASSMHEISHVFVPAAPHSDHAVAVADRVTRCPSGNTTAASYHRRNQMMIDRADALVAFVKNHRWYRSGEWSTISRARSKGIPRFIFPLNGMPPFAENFTPRSV